MGMKRLLIFGFGYSARGVAAAARDFSVTVTSRSAIGHAEDLAVMPIAFNAAESAIALATHILVTAPPDADGDPVLKRYRSAIAAAPALRWISYLSSTVVYGDRDGDWVDEDTPPAPSQPRGQRRLEVEQAWSRLGERCTVDIFRLAGIYGPGRSAFDDLRAGTARRIIRPGHEFGRVHRDDIGRAVAAAMRQEGDPGVGFFNPRSGGH